MTRSQPGTGATMPADNPYQSPALDDNQEHLPNENRLTAAEAAELRRLMDPKFMVAGAISLVALIVFAILWGIGLLNLDQF